MVTRLHDCDLGLLFFLQENGRDACVTFEVCSDTYRIEARYSVFHVFIQAEYVGQRYYET